MQGYRWFAELMSVLFALLLGAGSAPADVVDPVTLFRDACINGGATLRQGSTMAINAADLSAEARALLGRSLVNQELLAHYGFTATISAAQTTPNPMYRLTGSTDIILVLPTLGDVKTNAFASVCAVIVHDNQFTTALASISPKDAARYLKSKPHVSEPYYRGKLYKFEMTVAELNGWTSMAVVPSS